jgi:hypothetical protein
MRFAIRLLALSVSVAVAACNGATPQDGNNRSTTPAADGSSIGGDASTRTATLADTAAARGAAADSWREITIPAGTTLPVVLDTTIGSDISRAEEPVRAHLSKAVSVDGVTALPEGSVVQGVVTDAKRSGKVEGLAHVAVRFNTVSPRGEDERYRIETSSVGRTAHSTKKKDAVKILAPAAGGAIIGRIAGGKKGAAIGTAAGAGAGTAYVMSTRGEEVHLAKGTALTLKLTEPITVRVRS